MTDQLQSLEKILNITTHDDWRELYLYFSEYERRFQQEMEQAANWDTFVAARACRLFTRDVLMTLPERIKSIKESIEKELSDAGVTPDLNEYEQD